MFSLNKSPDPDDYVDDNNIDDGKANGDYDYESKSYSQGSVHKIRSNGEMELGLGRRVIHIYMNMTPLIKRPTEMFKIAVTFNVIQCINPCPV